MYKYTSQALMIFLMRRNSVGRDDKVKCSFIGAQDMCKERKGSETSQGQPSRLREKGDDLKQGVSTGS